LLLAWKLVLNITVFGVRRLRLL